jgi:Hypoxia induced protein conserved region
MRRMQTVLVILIVALMIATVVALVRGIVLFLQESRAEVDAGVDGPSLSQKRQNKMMFARIQFQALAVFACVVLLLVARQG